MKHSIKYLKTHFDQGFFGPSSTAYVATNEDLRSTLESVPRNIQRALTVAASGDHPMFTKLYGAKDVDTFDISFNAKLIMDIKTNALSLLNYEEYCEILRDIYASKNIINARNMPQIIEKLSPFEQKYIIEMQGKYLFEKKLGFISFPTETEFQKMQQVIKEPFNFIWSDLQTLHKKLNKTYDFIHLSNIFDYLGTYQNCVNILNSLTPYTNPGCNICITGFAKDPEAICEKFVWHQSLQLFNEQQWIGNQVFRSRDGAYLLQRTR